MSESAKERKELPWYIDIPRVVLMTVVIMVLFQALIARVYLIPSASMEPTLHGCQGCTGDRILVEKISYYTSEPDAGDVIVFEGTDSWNVGFETHRSSNPVVAGAQEVLSYIGLAPQDENILVKRIIATGGQTVSCQPGDPSVMVNGQPTDQSFILHPNQYPVDPQVGSDACGGPYFGPVTVPDEHYFVMGDSRTNSLDSRFHLGDEHQGAIPEENIRGKVQAIILPLNRIGGVADPEIQE